jgi:hypothetical protein
VGWCCSFTFPPSPPDSFGAAFPRRGIVPGGDWQGRQGKGDVHALGQLEHAFVRTPGTKSNLSLSAISPISHRMALSSRRGLIIYAVFLMRLNLRSINFPAHVHDSLHLRTDGEIFAATSAQATPM